jgi:hypothetical protein
MSLHASPLCRPKMVLALVAASGAIAAAPATAGAVTQTFAYTGAAQNFTVPANVDSLSLSATGAYGGPGLFFVGLPAGVPGGRGAIATVTATVTPGQTFTVDVGGPGSILGLPTFNGGGAGGFLGGGSGGGASDVCQVTLADTIQPSTCLVVAAGGGGAGGGFAAGAGGNADQAGATNNTGSGTGGGGGQPGTDSAGGAAGADVGGTVSDLPPYLQPGEFVLGGGPGGPGYVNQPASPSPQGLVSGGGGGGGGGGLYGGGGGGGGGVQTSPMFLGIGIPAGGGGGGGDSYAPDGTIVLTPRVVPTPLARFPPGPAPEVTITYTTTPGSLGGRRGGTRVGSGGNGGSTNAKIKHALSKVLAVSGEQAQLSQLVADGGVSAKIKLPGAGKLVVRWYANSGHKQTLVASGSLSASKASDKTLHIRLTKLGTDRLSDARSVKLTLTGTFAPTGQRAVTATTTHTFNH